MGFMRAWREKDTKLARKYLQKTWLAGPQTLEVNSLIADIDVCKWSLLGTVRVGKLCYDVKLKLQYKMGGVSTKTRLNVRVIKEEAPYKTSESGDWGLNPISLVRYL
jgi:hypothetical protein